MSRENEFKDRIKPSVYEEIFKINSRLNISHDKLLIENSELKEQIISLNNSFDNLTIELDNLESNYHTLNKPYFISLEREDISFSMIYLLSLIFISLTANLKALLNNRKAL